jgi:hypothetical protein
MVVGVDQAGHHGHLDRSMTCAPAGIASGSFPISLAAHALALLIEKSTI